MCTNPRIPFQIKDFFNESRNKSTKQILLSLKKKELKRRNIKFKDIMDMEIKQDDMDFE